MNRTNAIIAAIFANLVVGMGPSLTVAAAPASQPAPTDTTSAEAKYTQAISKRSDDIVTALDLKDTDKAARVHDIIMNQYRTLRDWHDVNDPKLKALAKAPNADESKQIEASRKAMHDAYLARLATELTPEQIETVKDKMVYGKVQFTYTGYLQAVPTMTDEEKAKVLELLKAAREDAMDGGSAEEKSAIFNKYKGKINNYLSQHGHGGKPKKATQPAAEPAN